MLSVNKKHSLCFFLPERSLLKHTSRRSRTRIPQPSSAATSAPSRPAVKGCVVLFFFVSFGVPSLSRRPVQDVRNGGRDLPALGRGASVAEQQRQDPDQDAGEDRLVAQEQHQASGREKPSVVWRQGVKGHASLAK